MSALGKHLKAPSGREISLEKEIWKLDLKREEVIMALKTVISMNRSEFVWKLFKR